MADHFVLTGFFNVFLGGVLGMVGGVLGIGGGLIAIPVLVFLYGLDQHLAQGTALVMITPNVLIGFLRYRERNVIELRSAAWLGGATILTTYFSARCASMIDARHLHVAFAWFLIVLAGYVFWQLSTKARNSAARISVSSKFLPIVGILSGGMSGLFTVGGGLIAAPALVAFFGMTQMQAQGMALALVIPGSLVALFTYAQADYVNWTIGIPLAVGGIVSVSWGVSLAHSFSLVGIRIMFCAVLLSTAAMMLM